MKKDLRQAVLSKMKQLPRDVKQRADRQLAKKLLASSAYQEAETIATYLSLPHEFQTQPFIRQALTDGKRIVIPKTLSQGEMRFADYEKNSLQKSSFGLLEPVGGKVIEKETIDLIHVPGLVFNQAGYRIGYGGGYYDRYLADFAGRTVSTIYDFQQADFLAENYDIAVKEIFIYETLF